jgi:hypothetical protein
MTRSLRTALVIALFPVSSLLGNTVGYTLSGVTTANLFTGPAIPAEFPVGTPFTATVQWETTSAPLFLSSTQGQYRLTEFTLSFTGKSGTWTTSALMDKGSFTLNHLGGGSSHELQFTTSWGPENVTNPMIEDLAPFSANLVLKDFTGTAIPSLDSAPGSLDLADWSAETSYLKLYLNELGSAYINGEITSIRSIFAPEISIKLPAGKSAVDGKSNLNLGKVKTGKKSKASKIVIRNSGPVAIRGLKIAVKGKNRKEFIISKISRTTLAPGASATFKVRFKPKSKGKRTADLRIIHSESGKNPFDIKLKGKGKKS